MIFLTHKQTLDKCYWFCIFHSMKYREKCRDRETRTRVSPRKGEVQMFFDNRRGWNDKEIGRDAVDLSLYQLLPEARTRKEKKTVFLNDARRKTSVTKWRVSDDAWRLITDATYCSARLMERARAEMRFFLCKQASFANFANNQISDLSLPRRSFRRRRSRITSARRYRVGAR